LQVSRSRAHNPSLSQLTGKYWRQATLTDLGKMHNTIDHMVGVIAALVLIRKGNKKSTIYVRTT
jgi:hypothetical protein